MHNFRLSDKFIEQFVGKQPAWGFGTLSYITYKRTYARTKDDGTQEEFWETLRRVVEGCFAIQKQHCDQFKLLWDNRKAQRSAQIMFEKMWNFKFLPPGRGLWLMGTDAVEKKGSGGLNNCFSYETEILTRQGIKQIGDLAGKEVEILTNSGWVTAPIKEFGEQQLYELVITRSGIEKSIFTTSDHKWFVKDRRQAYRTKKYNTVFTKDLRVGIDRLEASFGPNACKSIDPSPFGIAHGFVFGDGSTRQTQNESNVANFIGQKDIELKKYFINAVGEKCSGMPNFFKKLPDINENKAYLLGWLMGYFAADGSCKADGTIEICSYNKQNILFVRDVCGVLGIGTYSIRQENRVSNLTNKPCTAYKITFAANTLDKTFFLLTSHQNNFIPSKKIVYWTVKNVRPLIKIEKVFCATVPQQHCFTLADNILTSNCGMVSTKEIDIEFANPFCWAMDFLMLGVGIGFDVLGESKLIIKKPEDGEPTKFIIPDTREGWVDALREVLTCFEKGRTIPEFDYSLIRAAGVPIKTFGGTSSGPEPLRQMLKSITELLTNRIGQPITSVDIVDIFNFIGKAVVAGNVRRSAEIAQGRIDDIAYIECKDPSKFSNEMMDRRWASNNSVFASPGADYTLPASKTAINGEPGYIWLENARAFGRLKDAADHADYRIAGFNPCAEQGLESYELCNLVETFPANHDSVEEFYETLKYAYLYAKTVTLIPSHDPRTNAVMIRNRRIGTSMSGIEQAKKKFGTYKFYKEFCDKGYEVIKNYDKIYSDWLGIAKSIKVTTVKPSGTVSLLAGATPGVHAAHARYYYRTMRLAHNSPLIKPLLEAGYRIEYGATEWKEGLIVRQEAALMDIAPSNFCSKEYEWFNKSQCHNQEDNCYCAEITVPKHAWENFALKSPIYSFDEQPLLNFQGTMVVYFPIEEQNFTKGKYEQSLWEQMENSAKMQYYWSDNSVSVTINFKPEESSQIKTALELYDTRLKTVSFLPLEHGYIQAPYITIDETTYKNYVSKLKPIGTINTIDVDKKIEGGCESDRCVIPGA